MRSPSVTTLRAFRFPPASPPVAAADLALQRARVASRSSWISVLDRYPVLMPMIHIDPWHRPDGDHALQPAAQVN